MLNKQQIRQEMRKKILETDPAFFAKYSPSVITKLQNIDCVNKARTIGCYLSLEKEVNTRDFLLSCYERKVKTSVPAFNSALNKYLWAEYDPMKSTILGPFKIPQPDCIREIDPKDIDIFIVPGIAFDFAGNRLGHGGGFFDRLLKGIREEKNKKKEIFIIGLTFNFQLVRKIPVEEQDIKMDFIVTEKEVIICS